MPHQPSDLHPAVRLLATVLVFVPVWYGFVYAAGLMLVVSFAWTLLTPLLLRDMWCEVNHRDALTAAVDPHTFSRAAAQRVPTSN